jgi:chemotaxis signal transduction protein
VDLNAPAGLQRDETGDPGEVESRDYLVVQEGSAKFGIPIEDVREIIRVPVDISGDSRLLYQGGEIDVIDFAGGAEEGGGNEGPPRLVVLRTDPLVALLIPQVVGIWSLKGSEISPTVRFPVEGPVGRSLTGVVRVEGEMVFLLDASRIVMGAGELGRPQQAGRE